MSLRRLARPGAAKKAVKNQGDLGLGVFVGFEGLLPSVKVLGFGVWGLEGVSLV